MTGVQTCALPICFPVRIDGETGEEKPITEDELDEAVEGDFDLDELTKLYSTADIESDKVVKETSKLISEALHDRKWEKSVENLSKTYDDSLDTLPYDAKLEEIYNKVYITSQYIFKDDTIKTLRQKIAVSIPINPNSTSI